MLTHRGYSCVMHMRHMCGGSAGGLLACAGTVSNTGCCACALQFCCTRAGLAVKLECCWNTGCFLVQYFAGAPHHPSAAIP
jgi:hypothetical protein